MLCFVCFSCFVFWEMFCTDFWFKSSSWSRKTASLTENLELATFVCMTLWTFLVTPMEPSWCPGYQHTSSKAHLLCAVSAVFSGFLHQFLFLCNQVVAWSRKRWFSNGPPHSCFSQTERVLFCVLALQVPKGTAQGTVSQTLNGKNWYERFLKIEIFVFH